MFVFSELSLSQPALLGIGSITLWLLYNFFLAGKSSVKRLPLPPGREWLWGHERNVFLQEPGNAFREWTRAVGLTFRIKAAFGAPDVLVLSDPVGISYILQKKIYDYHHSKVVRPRVARLLGKGLGWVEGEDEHKRMRHLVSPSLSAYNIKEMTQDVRDAASRVVNDLTYHVEHHDRSCSTNILDWTAKATLNVIGRVAFLYDFDGGDSPEAQQILNGRRRGVSETARYSGFLTLMLLRRFPILNHLPVAAIQAQGMAKIVVQRGVAQEMIRRNINVVGETKGKDLLSRLLLAKEQGQISADELLEQISTFVVSGHETTTQTLGFTIWNLSHHLEAQERLRKELEEITGEPTYDDFQSKLPFLDAVLKETLRLYPGLPYMERVAMKDDVIPLRFPVTLANGRTMTEVAVSTGQTVLIPIIAIQRLDSVWDDPDTFKPERWLGQLPDADKLCSGWAHTLAFSDGPRNCIGSRLAIFQYKVILSSIIRRFVFKPTKSEITLKISSSLQPWIIGEPEKGPSLPVVLELI